MNYRKQRCSSIQSRYQFVIGSAASGKPRILRGIECHEEIDLLSCFLFEKIRHVESKAVCMAVEPSGDLIRREAQFQKAVFPTTPPQLVPNRSY